MSLGRCMCGATDCPSCGPDQGFSLDPEPTEGEIRSAANEIICDKNKLVKMLNDEFLAEYLADLMSAVDKACEGDLPALQAMARAGSNLQKCLRSHVEDEATQLAYEHNRGV